MMNIGEITNLTVMRKSDLGYMLTDGKNEVLLHFREASRELNDEENVDVFLYYDKKGRIAASMNEPFVTISKPGLVRVVESISDIGVFVDINCGKDVLISKEYLPYDIERWPDIDSMILVRIKERKNTLVGKPLNREEICDLSVNAQVYPKSTMVSGSVFRITEKGVYFYTDDYQIIYVNNTQMRLKYKLGDKENIKIVGYNEHNDHIGQINEQKEKLIDTDALIIIDYLKKHSGKMKITAKTSSDIILKEFNMSRKAFKRALGNLYKEQLVEITDEYTILK